MNQKTQKLRDAVRRVKADENLSTEEKLERVRALLKEYFGL